MAQLRQVRGITSREGEGGEDIAVLGTLDIGSAPDGGKLYYLAASPPEFKSTFAGSGLPFANAEQAFYNTPNRGVVDVALDGGFEVRLRVPNSYYVGMGTVRVPPTLYLVYYSNSKRVTAELQVSKGVPYRSLTYPPARGGPIFYSAESDHARSQEEILRASAYPETNSEAPDFWGGKPPR
jgi:hypothetical protein